MSSDVINGLFALGGALIGVLGTWFIIRQTKDRRQIQVTVSPLARLLDIGNQVKSHVTILYKDEPIEALSMGELSIQNTGTVAVEQLEMTVSPQRDSSVIEFETSTSNFSFDEQDVELIGDENARRVRISFLNPKDRLVLSYKLAGSRKRPDVVVRKLGVEVITRKDLVNWIPDIYSEIVYEMFSQMPLFSIFGRTLRPYRLYLEAREAGKTRGRL